MDLSAKLTDWGQINETSTMDENKILSLMEYFFSQAINFSRDHTKSYHEEITTIHDFFRKLSVTVKILPKPTIAAWQNYNGEIYMS